MPKIAVMAQGERETDWIDQVRVGLDRVIAPWSPTEHAAARPRAPSGNGSHAEPEESQRPTAQRLAGGAGDGTPRRPGPCVRVRVLPIWITREFVVRARVAIDLALPELMRVGASVIPPALLDGLGRVLTTAAETPETTPGPSEGD